MTEMDDWEDRDELTPEELEEFRGLLVAERERIIYQLQKHIREAIGDAENLPDEADQAKDATDRAYLVRLADKEQKLLKEIEHALAKFEEDEYGYCEGTGDLINPARLRLRPWTRYSLEYKESKEKTKRAMVGLQRSPVGGTMDEFGMGEKKRKKRVRREEDEEVDSSWLDTSEFDDEVPIPDDDMPGGDDFDDEATSEEEGEEE